MDENLACYPKQGSEFIGKILEVVSEETEIPVLIILNPTRKREIVEARQKAMKLAKEFTSASLATIGSEIGSKDHTTVLHACKTVDNLMDTDRSYRGQYLAMYIKVGRIINALPDSTFVCSVCGSRKVQTKVWISINSKEILDQVEPDDVINNWCPDCKAHTVAIPKKERNLGFPAINSTYI